MKNASKSPGKWAKNMGLLGIGLCALCCALPIIGIVGGTGLLAGLALYAEKITVVLLVVSGGLFSIWLYKKRQTPPACSIDCECKTDAVDSKSVNVNPK